MSRTTYLSCAVAGLAASAVLQAATASPATSSAGEPQPFLNGRVTETLGGGASPVADAPVTVSWIPGLDSARPGDELQIQSVGVTQTDGTGGYSIDVKPTAAMKRAAAKNDGWINFDVGVVDSSAGKAQTTIVQRRLVNGNWRAPNLNAQQAGPASRTAKRTVDVDATGATTDLVLTEASPDIAPGAVNGGDQGVSGRAGAAYCSFIVDARPQRYVNVVEFHNAGNSDARWAYGRTADSDIDGGADYSGDGGWVVSGTLHISNSNSASVFRDYYGVANNYGSTKFEFIDGHYQPYGAGSVCTGSSIPVNTKVKNPISWYGGVSSNTGSGSGFVGCDQLPQSANRIKLPVNAGFTRNTSAAAKIGAAVDLGPINVGARSGYSTNMDSSWTAKRGRGIWLCGTNSAPTTAGVIHAQNRPD